VIRSNGQTGLGRGTRAKSLLASGSYGRRHVHRLCGPEAIQQAEVLHQCRRHGLDADAQRPQGQWQPGEATACAAPEYAGRFEGLQDCHTRRRGRWKVR